jgi:hypothetical protein
MTSRDAIAAAALLLFAAAVAVESLRLLPYGAVRNPGPAFFPWWTSLTLALLSATLLVQSLAGRSERASTAEAPRGIKVAGVLAALAVYALVLEAVGYPVATFLLVLFMLRVTDPDRWPVALVTALVASGGTYLVFKVWLSVPLPAGPFAR